MRRIILIFLVGVALLTITVVAPVIWQSNDKPAQATPGLVIGFDMNPTGNTCPDNCRATSGAPPHCIDSDDCTLSSIETCVEVASGGGVIEFDVFLEGVPEADSVAAWQASISGWPGTLTNQVHDAGAVNFPAQPGSSIFDALSEAVPDDTPPHTVIVSDFGAAEFNPPYSHGVLGRYTLDTSGVSDGTYGLTIQPPGTGVVDLTVGNDAGLDLCLLYGCTIWDANLSPQYGLIAVGVSCPPAPTLTPTPTATPTLTPIPTTTATPTLTPTPTPPDLVAGWNHACYLGADLPISQALVELGTNVLAVYRLRPDQGYDKWFPNRPDISTITTVSPYEALFILMANDAAWPQEPGAAPPAGLDLAQGWNSACYCGQTRNVQSATAGIAGQYGVLYLLAPGQGWKRFIPARPEISNLAELQRFAAVLVLVSQPEGAHWVFAP